MKVRRCCLLIVVCTALMVPAAAFQQDAVTVLRFREVWDGERAIPNASVLIRGQRIAAVGADIAVPAGAREVDLRRLTGAAGPDRSAHARHLCLGPRAWHHAASSGEAPDA